MTNQEAIRILNEQRNKFMDEFVDFGGVNEAYNIAISLLERVVHCKDCKYKEWVGDSENIIYCPKMKLRTSIDWFCADGTQMTK